MRKSSPIHHLVLIIGVGLAARLLLAWFIPPAGDIGAWLKFSTYFEDGLSPYDASNRYNYSPVWFWIITAVSFVVKKTGLPFAFAIRLPIILGDLAIFAILVALGRRAQGSLPDGASCGCPIGKRPHLAATVFFLNPVSVLTSGMYGQFDNLSIAFALTALLNQGRSGVKLFWLNVSAAMKHFTLLLAPVFAFAEKNAAKRAALLLCAPLLFFASFIPYAEGAPHILSNVFGYNLHAGYWGWSGLITRVTLFLTGRDLAQAQWFHYLNYFNAFLYTGILAVSFWIARRYQPDRAVVAVFLLFYAFTTQMAPQYTVWIVPFAALRPDRFFHAYGFVGGVQLAAFYYCHYHWSGHIPIEGALANLIPEAFVVFRYLTWAVCVAWLVSLLRHPEARSAEGS